MEGVGKEIRPMVWGWYNWAQIWQFDGVFEVIFFQNLSLHAVAERNTHDLYTEGTALGEFIRKVIYKK